MKKASEVLNKQTSFSQWYADADIENARLFKKEDEEKTERLTLLNKVFSLPTNLGLEMSLNELLLIDENSKLLIGGRPINEVAIGIRLTPLTESDQLYRTRGKKLNEVKAWISSLHLEGKEYQANILPHVETPDFSTIFVVAKDGIKGEAILGAPHLLTQGFHENIKPIAFFYDFDKLILTSEDSKVSAFLNEIFSHLKISTEEYEQLKTQISDTGISHGFLEGYFETVTSNEYGLWFIDYNRYLGHRLKDLSVKGISKPTLETLYSGMPVSKGKVSGKAVVVDELDMEKIEFNEGDILVCRMTTPQFIPLMKKAGAILTQQGGVLSHAAIIARELGKPCIAGIRNLFDINSDGKNIHVDADNGIVTF